MGKSVHELRMEEGLNTILVQLESLQNMICTISTGLKNDAAGKQAVDAIECIGYCINGIKSYIEEVFLACDTNAGRKDMLESYVKDKEGE